VTELAVDDSTIERVQLDEASWVDVGRSWLQGADQLYEALLAGVAWQPSRLFRYDHWVEEKRLGSMWSRGRPLPHEGLATAQRALQKRYGVFFEGCGLIQYRDGSDGQAFHRDTDMRYLDDTIVAILTLGARRPWQLRPWSSKHRDAEDKGATHDLAPGNGDLIVMGGRCQADWQHSVPYRPQDAVGVRISLQWRHAKRVGKPFVGGSYGDAATYNRPR
jgi:alkylated DNA repair dioxygenase AlkB